MKQGRIDSLIFGILVYIGFSCATVQDRQAGRSVTDDLGRAITVRETSRILSLTPSVTELIATFVEKERIIGRTLYDSVPAWLLDKPLINNYPIDFEKILTLSPDLILAKEGMISADDVAKLEGLGFPVYMQRIDSPEDIPESARRLGALLDREERAGIIADSLENAIAEVRRPEHIQRPSVLLLISEEPIFAYGLNSYASDMIYAAGGRNAVDALYDNPFPTLQREYLLKIDPDVIIGVDSSAMLRLYPELSGLKSFRSGRVYTMNMELVSKPGPRVAEGVKAINRLLYAN